MTKRKLDRRGSTGHVMADLMRIAPAADIICSVVPDEHGRAKPVSASTEAGRSRLDATAGASRGQPSAGVHTTEVPADHSSCGDQPEK
jgi:hypothetical protein